MTVWWPRLDDIHTWLEREGYASRDWGTLAACLERPLTTLAGQEMYPSIWMKVAALLDSIERNQPLIDGNKRLGFLLASLVLNGNGISGREVSDDDWYDLVMTVASDHLGVDEIARRLRALIVTTS
ncbi:type II toxin-antitoxin system death-on-curing family toxin [Salana multivorans]